MTYARLKRPSAMLAASSIALAVAVAMPAATTAAGPHTCKGTAKKPGVLAAGTYRAGVLVKGVCYVNAGKARVDGMVTLAPKSALAAAFALNDRTHSGASGLTVKGGIVVGRGATLILGCNHLSFPCIDDPNQMNATLDGPDRVSGSLAAAAPLGVLVHQTTIGGSVTENGGGGGLNCNPQGAFKAFMSPVYSDYEDSSVKGKVSITNLKTCWLGVARVHVGGGLTFTANKVADPDAIEILSNHVGGALACKRNTSVWDSAEINMSGLYPRTPEPNAVRGKRSGQCKLASPATQGGPSGPGPF